MSRSVGEKALTRAFCLGWKEFLQGQVPRFNEVLTPYGLRMASGNIFDYEPENMPLTTYPAITIGNVTMDRSFISNNYFAEASFETTMNGYLVHDDSQTNADALRDFADEFVCVTELLEAQEIRIADMDAELYVRAPSEPPSPIVVRVELDYSFIGNAFLRSFHARVVGSVSRGMFLTES